MITFTLTIPDIEFLEFNNIDDFNALDLPTEDRAISNCQNYIRFYNIMLVISQFTTSILDVAYTKPSTLGSVPVSETITVTANNLEPIFTQYTTGDVSDVLLSSPSTARYTELEIQQAGFVLKTLVETVLANSYTQLSPVVGITSSSVAEVQYVNITAPATNSTITITAS